MKQAYPIGAQTLRMPLYTPDAVLPMRYGFRYTIQRGLDNFQAAAGAVNGLMVGTVDDGKRRVELCKGRRERLNEVKTGPDLVSDCVQEDPEARFRRKRRLVPAFPGRFPELGV